MLARWLTPKLETTLRYTPAVALLGPRQVGKTTLAQTISESRPALYLDLESPEDLLKLSDPSAFLSLHGDKLVIIDEIQRAPDLFMVLRGLIDKSRRAGRKGEQYLLLGSASMELLRQSSESLAGRISYLELTGLNLLEVPDIGPRGRQKLWLRGGFPESYLAVGDSVAMEWLENLIRIYLERDVPQMGRCTAWLSPVCRWDLPGAGRAANGTSRSSGTLAPTMDDARPPAGRAGQLLQAGR